MQQSLIWKKVSELCPLCPDSSQEAAEWTNVPHVQQWEDQTGVRNQLKLHEVYLCQLCFRIDLLVRVFVSKGHALSCVDGAFNSSGRSLLQALSLSKSLSRLNQVSKYKKDVKQQLEYYGLVGKKHFSLVLVNHGAGLHN